MTLAAHTDRGRGFVARQVSLVDTVARAWDAEAVHLTDTSPVDALFSRERRIFRIAEVKARELTLRALKQHGSYLVTFDKLVAGRDLAARLAVEHVLVVGLLDAIVWFPIASPAGEWQTRMNITRTTTPATCNGGSVERANAYLLLADMRVEVTL